MPSVRRFEIPERYGPYTTCYNRFVRWGRAGVLDPNLRGGLEGLRRRPADDRPGVDPCSPARRQRQGSEGEKRGAKAPAPAGDADDPRCVGRSRGGLTTKIHALVDANGLPAALKLTPGQAHDGRSADDMLDTVGKGQTLIAEAGYDSDRLRAEIKRRKAKSCIKPMPNRKKKHRPRKAVYAQRNRAGRFFNRIKHFRAIASRFEKSAANYLALVKLAAARMWMRFMSP